mmetsp:Transcript_18985/g.55041  ORF Transcript_18985/g.55041 Transcript_18985/m.55041 type:complete len:593 (+) Transcript_18985:296-2074(+)
MVMGGGAGATAVLKRTKTRDKRLSHKSPVLQKLAKIEGRLTAPEEKTAWIHSNRADTFFGFIIFLNAGFIGVDIELSNGDEFNWTFWAVETVFLIVFVTELIMRIWAERPWWRYFLNLSGSFDFFVTFIGILDAWVFTPMGLLSGGSDENPLSSFTIFRIFRLIRLVRLLRVIRMFSELVILVQTIGNSIRAVAWMSLLLGMIMYTGSILTMVLLGVPHRDTDPDVMANFGTLGNALFAHFCVVTLEAWPDIAMAAIKHNSLWALYFVFMIILTNFLLVNLMVGVIVERIIHASMEQENQLASFVAESEQFRNTLQALFDTADLDASGAISRKEVRQLLDDPRTHEIMSAFGINLDIPPETLHSIMDVNNDGDTSFEEFYHACIRLCGSKQSIHSVFVQADICNVQQQFNTRMQRIEARLSTMPRTAVLRAVPATATSPPAPAAPPGTGAEAALAELVERMDRFGQVQQHIYAEIYALKEHAKMQREPPREANDGSLSALARGDAFVDVAPMLLQKAGQELGACCIDSLFSRRGSLADAEVAPVRASSPAPPAPARWPPSPSGPRATTDLRARTRRELEAEFMSKRGPLARR